VSARDDAPDALADAARAAGGSAVTLLIRSLVKPGHDGEVRPLMAATFARIRAEEAACDVLVGHQSADDPQRFMVYEEWSDRDELERFSATREHMQEYFAQMAPHVEDFERSFWVRFI